MNDSQIRELDMCQRVRALANSRAADFPAGSHRTTLVVALKLTITQVETHAAEQDAAALDHQEATEQKRVAINSLLQQLKAISQTARSINEQFPGIADQFRMPRDSDRSILNRARAYINDAAPFASEFIKRDLPATFIADLQAAIDLVEAAETHKSDALARQTAATAGLRTTLKRLRLIVHELDAIMRNLYRQDPGSLAAWQTASHVQRAPQRKKKTTTTPPPAQPST
jgi:hypothetical protein